MKKIKNLDSLVYMLQVEESREIKDEKTIKILRDKIQSRIIQNNNILNNIKMR